MVERASAAVLARLLAGECHSSSHSQCWCALAACPCRPQQDLAGECGSRGYYLFWGLSFWVGHSRSAPDSIPGIGRIYGVSLPACSTVDTAIRWVCSVREGELRLRKLIGAVVNRSASTSSLTYRTRQTACRREADEYWNLSSPHALQDGWWIWKAPRGEQ